MGGVAHGCVRSVSPSPSILLQSLEQVRLSRPSLDAMVPVVEGCLSTEEFVGRSFLNVQA